MLPSLFLLIAVSCIMAASSISKLNGQVLKAQTDNAVSTPEQIGQYSRLDVIVNDLSAALELMSAENVQQDPTAIGKGVDSLVISDDYKNKVKSQ